jgi:hypothetical protein
VFVPLKTNDAPEKVLGQMFDTVNTYFASGKRICLLGAFAIYNTQEPFAREIKSYFRRAIFPQSTFFLNMLLPSSELHQAFDIEPTNLVFLWLYWG